VNPKPNKKLAAMKSSIAEALASQQNQAEGLQEAVDETVALVQ